MGAVVRKAGSGAGQNKYQHLVASFVRQPGAEPALTLGARLYLAGQANNPPSRTGMLSLSSTQEQSRAARVFFLFAVMLGACPTGVVFCCFVTLAIEAPKIYPVLSAVFHFLNFVVSRAVYLLFIIVLCLSGTGRSCPSAAIEACLCALAGPTRAKGPPFQASRPAQGQH